MPTLQHDVLSNKTGGNKTRLHWIGSAQQPKLDFGRKNTTNSNTLLLARKKKKKSKRDTKLLMTKYNQNFDLYSKKRYLRPLLDISKAGTGFSLVTAQTKLNDTGLLLGPPCRLAYAYLLSLQNLRGLCPPASHLQEYI